MPIITSTDIPYRGFPEGRTSPQAPNAYQQIPTDTSMFGALEGKAQEQFGAGLEKLGGGIFDVAIARDRVLNQAATDEGLLRTQNRINDLFHGPRDAPIDPETGLSATPGFLQLKGKAAIQRGVPRKELDAIIAEEAASMPERAKSRFLHQARIMRATADNQAIAHYDRQLDQYNEDVQHAGGLQAGLNAANNSDSDEGIDSALNDGMIRAARSKNPETQAIINNDRAVGSAIGAQIGKGNTARAQQIYDKYGHLLTESSRNQYGSQLRNEGRRDKIRAGAAEALGEPAPSGGGGQRGEGEPPGDPSPNPKLAGQRAKFGTELNGNPALKMQVAALIDLENPEAGTAVVESLMNRMHKSGGTIASGIGGGDQSFYGPVRRGSVEARVAELQRNPEKLAARMRQIDQALAGSNIVRGYTDQGSRGDPNYEGGGVGVNIAGERFNLHGGDTPENRKWREAHQAEIGAGGTRVAQGPSVTMTDAGPAGGPDALPVGPSGLTTAQLAGNAPVPAGGPSAPTVLPPVEVGAPAPAAAARPGGPKPMISLEQALINIEAIADREGYNDRERDEARGRTQAQWSLMRAKVSDQHKRLMDEVSNGAALLKAGRPFEYNEANIRHLMPPDEADKTIQFLQDAEDEGAANIALARLSPSEAAQWSKSLSDSVEKNPAGAKRRLSYLTHFNAAVVARDKALNGDDADPAAYLITRDTQHPPEPGSGTSIAALAEAARSGDPAAIQAYATATLREQERIGVLPNKQNILTKNVASGLAQQINKTDPGTADVGAQLATMEKQYGPHWNKAFGDMVKAGLPREAKMAGSMSHPDQAVARQDMIRTFQVIAEKGGKERFKEAVPESERKTIDTSLDTWIDEFRRSNPHDEQLTADVKESIQQLAYYYAYRGDTASSALRKATNGLVNHKYDFVDSSGTNVKLRVPKNSGAIVEAATDAVKHHLRPEDLVDNIPGAAGLTPERKREIMLDGMKNGYWATSADDNGAVLYLRTRDGAVARAMLKPGPGQTEGQQVTVPWTDARRLSAFAPPTALPGEAGPGGEYAPPIGDESSRGFVPLGYRALTLGR